jgi:F420-non-reducing hydrogenase small subunit
MAVTVFEEWLNACSGCEIAILNIGDALIDVLPHLNFVHITPLIDHKFLGQIGEKTSLDVPEAVVGILSGGIRNDEQEHILKEARKKTTFLIALGTCACYGGIPAQANMWKNEETFEKVYRQSPSTGSSADPKDSSVPVMTPTCAALDEFVKVDIKIPGCPPHPDWITDAILALLGGGTSWSLPERSVCDTCPTIREKKSGGGPVKRWIQNFEFNPEEGLDKMRCINEMGYLCQGPVTLAGCAGKSGVPRCIQARTPCRGCFGPIHKGSRPMVDMMGALSSVGMDPKSLIDRRAMLNRYIGAHGNLKVLPPRPGK